MKRLLTKYVLIMLGMVLVVAMGVIQTAHENQMAEEAAIQQQQRITEQGQKAKENTQWKIDHHGTIPAFKD